MRTLDSYLVRVVGAALAHDFRVPLGVIGRKVDAIYDQIEETGTTSSELSVSALLNQSKELSQLVDSAFDKLKEIGDRVREDGIAERERVIAILEEDVEPTISQIISDTKLFSKTIRSIRSPLFSGYSSKLDQAVDRMDSMLRGLKVLLESKVAPDINGASLRVQAGRIKESFEAGDSERSGWLTIAGDSKPLISHSHARMILQNIIENARKYSKNMTRPIVCVDIEDTEGWILASKYFSRLERYDISGSWSEMRISNNGDKIDPKISEEIFDLYRTESTSTDRAGGYGVGLALVKMLVTLYGGIVFHNKQNALRTEFVVLLPRSLESRLPMEKLISYEMN